jgi:hypothetical protein
MMLPASAPISLQGMGRGPSLFEGSQVCVFPERELELRDERGDRRQRDLVGQFWMGAVVEATEAEFQVSHWLLIRIVEKEGVVRNVNTPPPRERGVFRSEPPAGVWSERP